MDGLFLNPEILKTDHEIVRGNHLMDYDPERNKDYFNNAIIDIPVEDLQIVFELKDSIV